MSTPITFLEAQKLFPIIEKIEIKRKGKLKLQKSSHALISCSVKSTICVAKKARWVPIEVLKNQLKKKMPIGRCKNCAQLIGGKRRWSPKELEYLLEHRGKESVRKIAADLKRSVQSIRLFAFSNHISIPRMPAKGTITSQGYRSFCIKKNGRWYRDLEHRIVMRKMLGRNLLIGETVHHGPGGRADNRPENLSLRAPGKHPRGWSPQEMKNYLKTVPRNLGGLK